jgi:hypothetical protein
MGAYDDYSAWLASAAKWLHPDGSVTDGEGNTLMPPDASRAADYVSRSANAAKWLLPDGTLTHTPPSSAGTEHPPATGPCIPVIEADALGGATLQGGVFFDGWRDDVDGAAVPAAFAGSATAGIT